jgi:hypothetical protein
VDIAYDLEFLEDGRTIELISIGLVAEDGREYYAVNYDIRFGRVKKHDWLLRNVVPSLPITGRTLLGKYLAHHPNSYPKPSIDLVGLDPADTRVKPIQVISNETRDFILAAPEPRLWAWYGAYDHVALCQLWGAMIDLPPGIPMWTHELKQFAEECGNPELPELPGRREHNALSDAREVLYRLRWLRDQPK